jgi:hypothetical protein
MLGHGVFSKSITIYFRGEVAPLIRGRSLSVMYVVNSTLSGFFRIEKPFDSGFLVVHWLGDPKNPVTDVSSGLTTERAPRTSGSSATGAKSPRSTCSAATSRC